MFDQTAPSNSGTSPSVTPVVPANPYQNFADQTTPSATAPTSPTTDPVQPHNPWDSPMAESTPQPDQSSSTQDYSQNQPPVMSPSPMMQDLPASPTAVEPTDISNMTSSTAPAATEVLEDQNIFYLLGVNDGTEEQKNAFLDELQQVIWEDFLDEDSKLLLTQEELAELEKLKAAKPGAKLEEQEEVIVYLEKLIPDLEDILLEKALELKADLVKERMAGMRELYKERPDSLAKIDQAEQLVQDNKWLSAAQILNAIPA